MILLQDRAGYAQRILATLRQFQRPSHVALRHASAAQVPLLRSQLQRPIRFRSMSGHVVLSAQMQHIGQVAAFKWLQRQPKLTHIIQRHMVRIRNACRAGLGRKSPIKILAQRLDPASCASLPFKNDRLEAQFAKLVGAGKGRQASAHNDHSSLPLGRANKRCRSERRTRCCNQETPPIHHASSSSLVSRTAETASQYLEKTVSAPAIRLFHYQSRTVFLKSARSCRSASLPAPADECVVGIVADPYRTPIFAFTLLCDATLRPPVGQRSPQPLKGTKGKESQPNQAGNNVYGPHTSHDINILVVLEFAVKLPWSPLEEELAAQAGHKVVTQRCASHFTPPTVDR